MRRSISHFGPKLHVRKRMAGVMLAWDIRSVWLAKCDILAAATKRRLRAWIRPR